MKVLTPASAFFAIVLLVLTSCKENYEINIDKKTETEQHHAPKAEAHNLSAVEDQTVSMTLKGSDEDGDSLSFVIVDGPQHGVLSQEGPEIQYTPNANYHGDDAFTFNATDSSGRSSEVTSVLIHVNPVNDAPEAHSETITLLEDKRYPGPSPAVAQLFGKDVERSELKYSILQNGTKGSAFVDEATGGFYYRPLLNQNGDDSFIYEVDDGELKTQGTITVDITLVNDAPTISVNSKTLILDEDKEKEVLLGQEFDVDGELVTYELSLPANGTLLPGSKTNKMKYKPFANYSGVDSFTFASKDPNGVYAKNTGKVEVTVKAVNDAPAVPSSISIQVQKEVLSRIALSTGATDVDGDTLSFEIVTNPTKGTLRQSSTLGTWNYLPFGTSIGSDFFEYRAKDGEKYSNVGRVDLNIKKYQVDLGGDYSCVVDDFGLKCWGNNNNGQTNSPAVLEPSQISIGHFYGCMVKGGESFCWGSGFSSTNPAPSIVPEARSVSVGVYSYCSIGQTDVMCHDPSSRSPALRSTPEVISPSQLSVGYYHACVIDNGAVKCWGNESTNEVSGPASFANSLYVTTGYGATCVLGETAVQCWGDPELTKVPTLKNPRQIALGTQHACALDDDGVKCWGANSYGQSSVPTLNHPVAIAVGANHSCAIDNSDLKCWGSNGYGEIDPRSFGVDPRFLNRPSPLLGISVIGDFSVRVGQTRYKSITVSNTGTAIAKKVELRPFWGADFYISDTTCSSQLAPGESCTVRIAFSPTSTGWKFDKLEIDYTEDPGPDFPARPYRASRVVKGIATNY